jgi:hypothetical protein
MGNKAIEDLERGIRQDAAAAGRRVLLHQEVAGEIELEPVIDQVGGDDLVACSAQDRDDGTAAGCRFPDVRRQLRDLEQGVNGALRCLIEIVTAIGEAMAEGQH